MALLLQLTLASCATAPPSGQSCDDTMGSVGPLPDWVLLVVGVVVVIFVAAVVWRYARLRATKVVLWAGVALYGAIAVNLFLIVTNIAQSGGGHVIGGAQEGDQGATPEAMAAASAIPVILGLGLAFAWWVVLPALLTTLAMLGHGWVRWVLLFIGATDVLLALGESVLDMVLALTIGFAAIALLIAGSARGCFLQRKKAHSSAAT